MKSKTVDKLEKIQVTFLRCLLAVGTGCPTQLLYSETGTLLMEFRILRKKLMFLHHVHNLPKGALANEVLAQQAANNLPGIFNECNSFLCKFELNDLSLYSKTQFKRVINANTKKLNKEKLLIQMSKSTLKLLNVLLALTMDQWKRS